MIWIFMANRLMNGWRFEFLPDPTITGREVTLNADKGRDHLTFKGTSMGDVAGKFKNWYTNREHAHEQK